MRTQKNLRLPPRLGKSVSKRTEDAEVWAKSVEKPREPEALVTVEPLLVSEDTASQMLGISPRMVWELGDKGDLKVRRIGRRKLYLVDSLKAFAEGGKEVE